ncbi:MAG: type VII secretion protein EccB [Lacisediminihabitans sp.]
MATKKDLIEAQGFSRRRLLSAFTGGAPGGKELEPAKPLRAVVAGIVLTAMVVLGGVFYGMIRPGLPTGWQNNHLILASDSGARYLSVNGVLHPVINTASARLLIPAGKFSVITTDQKTLAGITIGGTIGIPGAPDNLPSQDALVGDGWAACATDDAQTAVALSQHPLLDTTTKATLVKSGTQLSVIAGEHRYTVDHDHADSVLRAVGLDASSAIDVDSRWLSLFEPGAPLTPITVPGAGTSIPGSGLEVGAVVHPQGSPDSQRFLVTAKGELAPISPLAYQLYLLGSGAKFGVGRQVTPAEIASLATAKTPAGGVDWPSTQLTAVAADAPRCALLSHTKNGDPHTALATLIPGTTLPSQAAGVRVSSNSGALVRVGGSSAGGGMLYLINDAGTAYPIPGANNDIIARLGYTPSNVTRVPESWIDFMPAGTSLTEKAAGGSANAGSVTAGGS